MKEIEIKVPVMVPLALKPTEVWIRYSIGKAHVQYGVTEESNLVKIKVPGYEFRHPEYVDLDLAVIYNYKMNGKGGFIREGSWRVVNRLTGGGLSRYMHSDIEKAIHDTINYIKERPSIVSAEVLIKGAAKLQLAKPLEFKS